MILVFQWLLFRSSLYTSQLFRCHPITRTHLNTRQVSITRGWKKSTLNGQFLFCDHVWIEIVSIDGPHIRVRLNKTFVNLSFSAHNKNTKFFFHEIEFWLATSLHKASSFEKLKLVSCSLDRNLGEFNIFTQFFLLHFRCFSQELKEKLTKII